MSLSDGCRRSTEESTFTAWPCTIPKANILRSDRPRQHTRITDPSKLPANQLICFYRPFRKDERSVVEAEPKLDRCALSHMVRSTSTPNSMVMGSNSADRDGITPTWSLNDLTKMFDGGGTEETTMFPPDSLTNERLYGEVDKQQFVAFAAPVRTVASRLKAA